VGILHDSPQWAVSIALITEVLLIFLAVSGFAEWLGAASHQNVLPVIIRSIPLLLLLIAIPVLFGPLYIGMELFIVVVVGVYAYLFRDRPTSIRITGMPAVLIVGLIFALMGLIALGAGVVTGSTIVIVIGILFALIGAPLAYEAWQKRGHL
jgi:hypothetical protein